MLSSTQIGAIGEAVVASGLMIASEGRLSPFAPAADDDGIDLLVYDKRTGRALPLQVKSRTVTIQRRGRRTNVMHFEVRSGKLKADSYAWFLGVLLTQDLTGVAAAWAIPMRDVPSLARATPTKFVMRPSRSAQSQDRYSRYRCTDLHEVARRMMEHFDSVSPRNQSGQNQGKS